MIAGRRAEPLEATAAAAAQGNTVLTHAADVADRQHMRELVDDSLNRLGGLDIVVHAAGINIKNRSMAQMRPEQWDQILSVNATGVYNVLYAVLPTMRSQRDGLIVNVTSIAGKRASDLGGIAYCASKFAASALGTAVGLEESANGIRVTNLYPGEVDTPLLEQRPTAVSDEHRQRILRPEHVARAVVSLCRLPPPIHIPELIIKPLQQPYW